MHRGVIWRTKHFSGGTALDRYLEWVKKALSHALLCIGALDTFQMGSLTLEPALSIGVIFAIETVISDHPLPLIGAQSGQNRQLTTSPMYDKGLRPLTSPF